MKGASMSKNPKKASKVLLPTKEDLLTTVTNSKGIDWLYSQEDNSFAYTGDLLISARQKGDRLEVFYGDRKVGIVDRILNEARVQERYAPEAFEIKPRLRIPKPA